eukprot:scaffold4552_cov161-Amphora_coffeaeformis.AAC.1
MIQKVNKGNKIVRVTAGLLVTAVVMGVTRAQALGVPKGASFHNTVALTSENESITPPNVPVILVKDDRRLMRGDKSTKDMKMKKNKKKNNKKDSSTCVPLSSVEDDAGDEGTRLRRKLLNIRLDQMEEEETDVEETIPEGLDERELQRWKQKNNKRKKNRKGNRKKVKKNSMPGSRIQVDTTHPPQRLHLVTADRVLCRSSGIDPCS